MVSQIKPRPDRLAKPVRRSMPVIEWLGPGQKVPDCQPKRYFNKNTGYVRLRWLVGTQHYVECYEHRVVDGYVTTADEVHHSNKDRTDNRPENLRFLSSDEHQELHKAEVRGRGKYAPFRSLAAAEKAAYAEHGRRERAQRAAAIRAMRDAGLSTVEIGRRVGLDSSGVSRYLIRGRNW